MEEELGDDRAVDDEVGQADVVDVDELPHGDVGEARSVGAVAGHLRGSGESTLEGGGAGGDGGDGGKAHEGDGAVVDDGYGSGSEGGVYTWLNGRGSGNDGGATIGDGAEHDGEVGADLAHSAAGDEGYDRPRGVDAEGGEELRGRGDVADDMVDFLDGGVADVGDAVVAQTLGAM